jgi:hypothetical protein
VLWDSIVDLKDAINLQDLGLAINTAGMLPFAPRARGWSLRLLSAVFYKAK